MRNVTRSTSTLIRRTAALLLLLPILSLRLSAQQTPAADAAGTSVLPGTEYYIGFPPSDESENPLFMGLLITSEHTTEGIITIPDVPTSTLDTIRTFTTRAFSVQAGKVTMIEVPRPVELDYPGIANHSGEASQRTVHITSRAPISVTVVNARQGAAGGYPVLPVDRWGTQYTPIALPASYNTKDISSQILITAAYDGTSIEVSPSADASKWNTGETITFTLDRNQSWLLQANTSTTSGSRDLSGTIIRSTKPIGVVAGHSRASLSLNPTETFPAGQYAAWHASMQMPTEGSEWGTEYFSTPMRNSGDRFRIIAREKNTTIRLTQYDNNGNPAAEKLIPITSWGQVIDISNPDGIAINRPSRWSSDKPFAIMQIETTGGDYADPANSPAMIRLVPTSRYASHLAIALPAMIRSTPFNPFRLEMVVNGTDNPSTSLTIDGKEISQFAGMTQQRISGRTWRVSLSVAPEGHIIRGTGGTTIAGYVMGNNGSVAGTVLAWELPHWYSEIQADVEPPHIVTTTESSPTEVVVNVSDRTSNYFSGVDEVAVYDNPNWERISFNRPADPDVDASALFRVKAGVDPSGPLVLLLRDRDGNIATTKVYDGVCLKTAYPAADTIRLVVGKSGEASETFEVNANPCGDAAEMTWLNYDASSTATNSYLQSPEILPGESLPYTIDPLGKISIRVATISNIKGVFTRRTTLEMVVNGQTISVPVVLTVDNGPSSVEDEAKPLDLNLSIRPNPFNRATFITLDGFSMTEGAVEIVDSRGRVVRTFSQISGSSAGLMWDGTDNSGGRLESGLYIVRVRNGEKEQSQQIILTR